MINAVEDGGQAQRRRSQAGVTWCCCSLRGGSTLTIFKQRTANPFCLLQILFITLLTVKWRIAEGIWRACQARRIIQRLKERAPAVFSLKIWRILRKADLRFECQKLNLCATWLKMYSDCYSDSCSTSRESRPQPCSKLHWTLKCLLSETDDDAWWQMARNLVGQDWTRFRDFLQNHKVGKKPIGAELRRALKDFPTTNRHRA